MKTFTESIEKAIAECKGTGGAVVSCDDYAVVAVYTGAGKAAHWIIEVTIMRKKTGQIICKYRDPETEVVDKKAEKLWKEMEA